MDNPTNDDESTDYSTDAASKNENEMDPLKQEAKGNHSPKDSKRNMQVPTDDSMESTLERRRKRRRELNRLSKLRRRQHRKEFASTLENEVHNLKTEYSALSAENVALRLEWEQCLKFQQQHEHLHRASTQRPHFPQTYQSPDFVTQLSQTVVSLPMRNAHFPNLLQELLMGQQRQQQQDQAVLNLAGILSSFQGSIPHILQASMHPNQIANLVVPPLELFAQLQGQPSWTTPIHSSIGAHVTPHASAQWQIQNGPCVPATSNMGIEAILRTLRPSLRPTQQTLSSPQQTQNFFQNDALRKT